MRFKTRDLGAVVDPFFPHSGQITLLWAEPSMVMTTASLPVGADIPAPVGDNRVLGDVCPLRALNQPAPIAHAAKGLRPAGLSGSLYPDVKHALRRAHGVVALPLTGVGSINLAALSLRGVGA